VIAGAISLMPLQSLDAELRWVNYSYGFAVAAIAGALLFALPLLGSFSTGCAKLCGWLRVQRQGAVRREGWLPFQAPQRSRCARNRPPCGASRARPHLRCVPLT